MITAYHPSTNEQTKKTNQIIETFLQCLFVKEYEKKWNEMLFQIEYALNIFENVSTEIFSFEIFYEVKPKDFLMKIIRKDPSNTDIKFLKNRRQIKTNVINVVKMTQAKMTILFDKKHCSPNLEGKVYLKMIKTKKSKYYLSKTSFLSTKKLRLFFIKRKINSLIYELNLSNFLKIHSVISVIHLEQYKKNSFDKKFFEIRDSNSIIVNEQKQYVVKKIVKFEIKVKELNYVVKWKKYEKTTWKSKVKLIKNVSKMICHFQNQRRRQQQ